MHICMVGVKGIPLPAGIDNVVEQVGSRLVKRGHRVTVYVRAHYTPRNCHEWKGMRLVHVPSIRTKGLDAITSTFFAIHHAIATHPDVVHIHSTGLSVFAPFPRLWGIPTVVQSHGLDWQREKWHGFARCFLKFTDYSTAKWPTVTTAVSRKLTRYYRDHYGSDVVYIPNGAPPVQRQPVGMLTQFGLDPQQYILFAARLVPEKWCHGLIQAYKSIHNPGKVLVIAGDGSYGDPYAEKLKNQASENIRFLGFVTGEPMQALLSHAYTYVLPSKVEGLSTGLIEAMAYGNCCLVSDIEENLEAIGGRGGLTFRSGNTSCLCSELKKIMDDPNLAVEYGKRASDFASREYDWEKVTTQFEELYIRIVSN